MIVQQKWIIKKILIFVMFSTLIFSNSTFSFICGILGKEISIYFSTTPSPDF